jgi:hypothetical protein
MTYGGEVVSEASFNRELLSAARDVTGRRKLRLTDIVEWSCSEIAPQVGEELFFVPSMGVHICVVSLSPRKEVRNGL